MNEDMPPVETVLQFEKYDYNNNQEDEYASTIEVFDDQLKFQRGIEAVLWSMPAISDVYFRESLFRDFQMRPNEVLVMSKPLAGRHKVLTANNRVNYVVIPFDLTNGPLVIEIPPGNHDYAVIGQICDNWQIPVSMVGIEGPDGGKGGKYLLLPPDCRDRFPGGYIDIHLKGFKGTMFVRSAVLGKGTIEGAVALAYEIKSYLFPDTALPAAIVDGWSHLWNSLPAYDINWFRHLAMFVNDEPIRERDKAMVGMLGTLGIEKGKSFDPDPKTIGILNTAAATSFKIMQSAFITPGRALTPWWAKRQWANINPGFLRKMAQGWSYDSQNALWSYERAIAPYFWANYLPKKLGGRQLHLVGIRDSNGHLLSGKSSYRLCIAADVPVEEFWSVIVYSLQTKSFISNTLDQIGLGSYDPSTYQANKDGSVDIFFGNDAPPDLVSNWLPSAGEDFFVIIRFYGPGQSIYKRTWELNDIEEIG
jgi:hypothetical protein